MTTVAFVTAYRIRLFRMFFAICLFQACLYYVVPAVQFPPGYVFHIEVVSALTLGNVVTVFMLLVNIAGLVVDRRLRPLYASLLVFGCLWLVVIAVTWSRLERWEFLLR